MKTERYLVHLELKDTEDQESSYWEIIVLSTDGKAIEGQCDTTQEAGNIIRDAIDTMRGD